jgi:hypothetical protein
MDRSKALEDKRAGADRHTNSGRSARSATSKRSGRSDRHNTSGRSEMSQRRQRRQQVKIEKTFRIVLPNGSHISGLSKVSGLKLLLCATLKASAQRLAYTWALQGMEEALSYYCMRP